MGLYPPTERDPDWDGLCAWCRKPSPPSAFWINRWISNAAYAHVECMAVLDRQEDFNVAYWGRLTWEVGRGEAG